MKQDLQIIGFLLLEVIENTALIFGLAKFWEVLSKHNISNWLLYMIIMSVLIFLIIEKYIEIKEVKYIRDKINEKRR